MYNAFTQGPRNDFHIGGSEAFKTPEQMAEFLSRKMYGKFAFIEKAEVPLAPPLYPLSAVPVTVHFILFLCTLHIYYLVGRLFKASNEWSRD